MGRVICVDADMGVVPLDMLRGRFPSATITETDDITSGGRDDAGVVLLTGNRWWKSAYLEWLEPGDWVTTIGAGHDAFPIETFRERNISFTTSRGVNAAQVADHAVALVLSIVRNLPTYYAQQRSHDWTIAHEGMSHLADETAAIVGIGHIGEAVAKRLTAFGMDVRGVKRDVAGYDGVAEPIHPASDLLGALDEATVCVLAVPHTDETAGLIGRTAFDALGEDAVLVNVGRGPIVDTDALVAALDEGVIGSAGLDVTDPEPLPATHPLWEREDVVITPHCAGVTDGYAAQYLDFFAAQFERWVDGGQRRQRVV